MSCLSRYRCPDQKDSRVKNFRYVPCTIRDTDLNYVHVILFQQRHIIALCCGRKTHVQLHCIWSHNGFHTLSCTKGILFLCALGTHRCCGRVLHIYGHIFCLWINTLYTKGQIKCVGVCVTLYRVHTHRHTHTHSQCRHIKIQAFDNRTTCILKEQNILNCVWA